MILGRYRELGRAMDAEKWVGITPEAVEAARKQVGVCGECEAVCQRKCRRVRQAMLRRKA